MPKINQNFVRSPTGRQNGCFMDVELILKAAGVAMIITVVCQVMSKVGKEDQSALVSLVGTVVILLLVASKLGELVRSLMDIFSL